MARLNSLDSLARNKSSIIFGDQGENLMGNLEAFKMVYDTNGLIYMKSRKYG